MAENNAEMHFFTNADKQIHLRQKVADLIFNECKFQMSHGMTKHIILVTNLHS